MVRACEMPLLKSVGLSAVDFCQHTLSHESSRDFQAQNQETRQRLG